MYISNSLTTARFSTAHYANAVNNKLNKETPQTQSNGSVAELFKSYTKKTSGEDRIRELMDRKQKILDIKEQRKQQDIQKGYDQKSIEADLAQYDSEAAEIDQQIAQIRQEDAKKAAESKNSGSDKKANGTGSIHNSGQAASKTDDANLQQLTSLQKAQPQINAIKHASRILKTQALRYQPSHAFEGHPGTSAKLTAKAEGLQSDLAGIYKKANQTAKKTESSRPSRKTHIQEYKKALSISRNNADSSNKEMDKKI